MCGGSFVKGRGLSIHQTKAGCRLILESRKIKHKSTSSGLQDLNHSDSTKLATFQDNTVLNDEVTSKLEKTPKTCDSLLSNQQVNNTQSRSEDHEERFVERENSKEVGPIQEKRKHPEVKESKPDASKYKQSPGAKKKISMDIRKFCVKKQGRKSTEALAEKRSSTTIPEEVVCQKSQRSVEDPRATTEKVPTERNTGNKGLKKDCKHRSSQTLASKDDKEFQVIDDEISIEKGENIISIPDETTFKQQDIRSWCETGLTSNSEGTFKKLVEEVNTGPPDDVISKHSIEMTRRDYRSLSGKNWINDKIIDEYFTLIKERNLKNNLAKVTIFSTHAFTKLEQDFDDNFNLIANRWVNEDLTLQDKVLIPIFKEDHWSLVVVIIKDQRIDYYDSILGRRHTSSAPRIFRKFFNSYFEMKGKEGQFKSVVIDNAPIQRNGYDCGTFVCQNAEKAARGVFVNSKQEEMAKARRKMMKEIFQGELLTDESQSLKELYDKVKTDKKKNRQHPKVEKQRKKKTTKTGMNNIKESKEKESNINWPRADSKEWQRFDEDVTELLKTIYSAPDKKAKSHPKIIYEMSKERFGLKEKKENIKQGGPSRRQRKCAKLRSEINILKKAYLEAPEEEKPAIQELNNENIRALRIAKRAESIKKNRKQYTANCLQFLSQPYKFARNLLKPKPKGQLESSQVEVETFLEQAHSNPIQKERNLLGSLQKYDEPEVPFNDAPPTYKEFMEKLRKTRSKSAPGPNGVPYVVYKRCPGVAKQLWFYLRDLWKRNTISDEWRKAEGVFIPKEDGANQVERFRTISLLNVEGKLFFSLKADRMTRFLLANKYMDPSIQKGGIPGVSGCLEHTAILSQLIREAKKEKKNLVVTWLDIANAYGSIPHDVILAALKEANIPERARDLVKSYYEDVKIRFTTRSFTTKWQQVERGIITGCTLSVVLFALTMSWLVESVKKETKGPKTSTGQRQANSRLFMDDITTTTETVPQTNCLLEKLSEKLKWAGLDAKAIKCRSLVIMKGIVKKGEIKIDGKAVTPLQEMPVRYLGKKYTSDLGEKQQTELVEQQLKADLKKMDKCLLPGRYKCWILQHMLLRILMWPLTIYNIPVTKIELMQRKMTVALKRWLKIPKSFSSDCLYSRTSKLRLPFTSLTEEYKTAKARSLITLETSTDPCISNAGIAVDGGKKANTQADVQDAKSRLQMKEITGIANRGREGLGMRKRQYYSTSSKSVRRDMVIETIKEREEEQRVVKMASLGKQGVNLKWEVPQRYLKEHDVFKMSETSLSFLIRAVYDLLPTPSNKNRWFGGEERCKLCGQEGTLNHLLAGCQVALSQGRYKWRHDQVLKELAKSIDQRLTENLNTNESLSRKIQFVKEGEKGNKEETSYGSYLSPAKDWKMKVDLEGRLQIPKDIVVTNLRPDITLISSKTKQFGMIELTVPSEERIEVSGELKRQKYEKVALEARTRGWRVKIWAVEVGCKGFPAVSLSNFLKDIGYKGGKRKKICETIGRSAEQASHSLWKASFYKDWGTKK